MKKFGILVSVTLATLLIFGGCEKKESEPAASGETQSVERSVPVAKEAKDSVAEVKESEKKSESVQTPVAVEEKSPVEEKVTETAKKVEEKATEIAQSVKEEAKEAVEAAKSVVPAEEKKDEGVDAKALYGSKCAGCHGTKGEKHALGKSNVIAGQSKAELVQKMSGYKDGSYGGAMKQIMAGQVSSLSEEQIEALADYISKL